MPLTGRVDRRYCRGACRTLAYRVRRRVKAARPPGPLEPLWAEPSAVVKTMLTSLAQIQARVLDFAHQLEHEELYARPPVRTAAQPPQAEASDPQNTDALAQVRVYWEAKEEDTESIQRASIVVPPEPPAPSRAHVDAAASTSNATLAARLEEVTQQRDQLQAELLAERERTGRLDTELKNLHKEASDAIGRMKHDQRQLQRENEHLVLRVRDLQAQLQQASQTLATWEQAGSESMTMVANSNSLQRENALLRAEVRRLRPPSADADPLLLLMLDRVKALHWLAYYEMRRGVKVTGQLLPNFDNEQILAAAQYQAFAARRDFYFRGRGPYEPVPRWEKEDYLLDEASEKKLCDDAQFKNRDVCNRMESARYLAGEHP